jgi:glyoxalase family protein
MAGGPRNKIQRHHHVSLGVGGAQQDYDFHTGVLSLKLVKRTALYESSEPIYHLYYGNDHGEESTLVTCFPMRQTGRKAGRGAGQFTVLGLSVPVSSLGYWDKRLREHGFAVEPGERFGERLLRFAHPCGIDYELVGIADDPRTPFSNGEVPAELAIRGTHGITLSTRELESPDAFMNLGWGARRLATDGRTTRYVVGPGGPGCIVDVVHQPSAPVGTQDLGEGAIHHCAFQVADFAEQDAVKDDLLRLGLEDVTDRKDRGYFHSIYVREPGGAMFEATVSKPEGFLIDEPYEDLGRRFHVPPQFAGRSREILAALEPVTF